MNWFEPIFAQMTSWGPLLAEVWRIGAIFLLSLLVASLAGSRRSMRSRLIVAALLVGLWESVMPASPLSFLEGRAAGLQDEVLIILLLALAGLVGIARNLRRPALHQLPLSLAALLVAGLGYAYHLVLINGLDAQMRAESAGQLSRLLSLEDDAWRELCALEVYTCGTGLPASPHTAFEQDLTDWMNHALPSGTSGRIASSDGTLAADPPHVWAAERKEGRIRWIMQPRVLSTQSLQLAFFSLSMLALVFWTGAAIAVEHLHRRRRHR